MRPLIFAIIASAVAMTCVPPSQTPQQGYANAPPPGGAAPAYPGGGATCDSACAHLLGCFEQDDAASRTNCNAECVQRQTTPDQLAQIQGATCEQLAQYFGAGQQGQVDFGAAAGAASGGGCSADCTGCVWDGSSCYHGTGLACDSCCCAPGGPAARWD